MHRETSFYGITFYGFVLASIGVSLLFSRMNYKKEPKFIQMEAESVYTTLSNEPKVPEIREDLLKEYNRKGKESYLTITTCIKRIRDYLN